MKQQWNLAVFGENLKVMLNAGIDLVDLIRFFN